MKKGIDLSEWQTQVDYTKLKRQGIDFAIIRCGYGRDKSQKDKMFEKHYEGLKKAGIKIGCYIYSYANKVSDGKLEAQNCLNFIKGKTFDLPVFYDLEDKVTSSLGKTNITMLANAFLTEIKKAGYNTGIYANLNWFNNYINLRELKNRNPNMYVWLAQWEVSKPTASFNYDFWQYTSNGKLDGISGRVDMNYQITKTEDNSVGNVENRKSNEEIAKEVWQGLWGNGQERVDQLTRAGYDYTEIQKIVDMTSPNTKTIKAGDKVKVLKPVDYNGQSFGVYFPYYNVIEIKGDRAVIGKGATVTAAINVKNLSKLS